MLKRQLNYSSFKDLYNQVCRMGSHCSETHLMVILHAFSSMGLRPHWFSYVVGRIPRGVSEYMKVVKY